MRYLVFSPQHNSSTYSGGHLRSTLLLAPTHVVLLLKRWVTFSRPRGRTAVLVCSVLSLTHTPTITKSARLLSSASRTHLLLLKLRDYCRAEGHERMPRHCLLRFARRGLNYCGFTLARSTCGAVRPGPAKTLFMQQIGHAPINFTNLDLNFLQGVLHVLYQYIVSFFLREALV